MLSAGCILMQIKYYKGLGTSNTDEAREYFSRIDKHRKEFEWQGDCTSTTALTASFISSPGVKWWQASGVPFTKR